MVASSNAQADASDIAKQKRLELEQKRQLWLQQRDIDNARQQVEATQQSNSNAGGSAGASGSSFLGGVKNNNSISSSTANLHVSDAQGDVINRLTENIANKLRVEIANELKTSGNLPVDRNAAELEMSNLLTAELESHNCPVCMMRMLPAADSEDGSDHTPMLLFPCGHNLCATCVNMHFEKQNRRTCPHCRSETELCTINRPMKEMIMNLDSRLSQTNNKSKSSYVANGGNTNSSSALFSSSNSSGLLAKEDTSVAHYLREYRNLTTRLSVLENEKKDGEDDLDRFECQLESTQKANDMLMKDEQDLMAKIAVLKKQLKLVDEHRNKQQIRMDDIERRKNETIERCSLIENTIRPLLLEKDKCRLILENMAPEQLSQLDRSLQ